jgi:hypothetical protein
MINNYMDQRLYILKISFDSIKLILYLAYGFQMVDPDLYCMIDIILVFYLNWCDFTNHNTYRDFFTACSILVINK